MDFLSSGVDGHWLIEFSTLVWELNSPIQLKSVEGSCCYLGWLAFFLRIFCRPDIILYSSMEFKPTSSFLKRTQG